MTTSISTSAPPGLPFSRDAALRLFWRILHRLGTLALGGVFFGAGLLKALILPTFAVSTATVLSLPASLGYIAAVLVLLMEVLVGLALLGNRVIPLALKTMAVMLGMFILVLARADMMDLHARCNCFGSTSLNLSYSQQILIDIALLALVAVAYRTRRVPPTAPDVTP